MTQANEGRAQPEYRWIIRIFMDGGGDPQIYTNVKHVWWTAGNTVLTLLQYYDDGSYRYVNWPRERVYHYTRTLDISKEKTTLAHIAYMDDPEKQGVCYCQINHSHPGPGLVP